VIFSMTASSLARVKVHWNAPVTVLVVPVPAEDHQVPGEFGQGLQVVGAHGFALQDREVALDLVQPGACTGRWISRALGTAFCIRHTDALPQWLEPLSTARSSTPTRRSLTFDHQPLQLNPREARERQQ
jgi:hypothetical protein